MTELTPTQCAFADRILNDAIESLFDGVALDPHRVKEFRTSVEAGIANYDLIRTQQVEHVREELERILNA